MYPNAHALHRAQIHSHGGPIQSGGRLSPDKVEQDALGIVCPVGTVFHLAFEGNDQPQMTSAGLRLHTRDQTRRCGLLC